MKTLITIVTTAILFLWAQFASQKQSITVKIPKISSNYGTVKFALYQKENFGKTPTQTLESEIIDGKTEVIFKDLEPGEYAITCYHDKNSNGKLDFAASGMPLESFGISNNPVSFGPPQYRDAYFQLGDKNLNLEIKF